MSAPDPNWFYSALAQSAAAIVGLIGAFVTSRVMMMASERSRIEKRINEIDAEIKELERQNAPLLEYIAEIDRKDEEEDRKEDAESVNSFLRAKKPELDLENLPTADEMLKELLEGSRIRISDENFVSMFKEEYGALIEEIRVEKEEEIRLNHSLGSIGELVAQAVRLSNSYAVQPNLPLLLANPHKYDRYNKYQEIIRKNDTEISYKKAKIQELQHQVSQIILPEHFKGLIFSLIYFTIVGVILPLWLLPITSGQHLVWKPIVIGLFITGLCAVFRYIFIEIKYITKKTKQCSDSRLKLLMHRSKDWFTTHITQRKRRHRR
jgi:hypothetical protein